MGRRSMLALLAITIVAAAVVAGFGTSVALAGESTGNCGAGQPVDAFKGSDTAAANCKGPLADPVNAPDARVSNGNSWCSYSGQNDYPDGSSNGPGGRTQSYGQDVKLGLDVPNPGTACNPQDPNNFGGGNPPPRK